MKLRRWDEFFCRLQDGESLVRFVLARPTVGFTLSDEISLDGSSLLAVLSTVKELLTRSVRAGVGDEPRVLKQRVTTIEPVIGSKTNHHS